jgi:hypothetical protein
MNLQTSFSRLLNQKLTDLYQALDKSKPLASNAFWGRMYIHIWNAHEQIDWLIRDDLNGAREISREEINAAFATLLNGAL